MTLFAILCALLATDPSFESVATVQVREVVRTAFLQAAGEPAAAARTAGSPGGEEQDGDGKEVLAAEEHATDASAFTVVIPRVLEAPPLRLEFLRGGLSRREASRITADDPDALVCYRIAGRSMMPSFRNGEHVVVAELPAGDAMRDGDVVIARVDGHYVIKRVAGLPGETVEVRHGRLFREGLPVEEPIAERLLQCEAPYGDAGPVRLGPDQYFLLGDNRAVSVDSRDYGPLPAGAIAGRVLCHVRILDDAHVAATAPANRPAAARPPAAAATEQ